MFNTLPLLSDDMYHPTHIPDTWSQLYFHSQISNTFKKTWELVQKVRLIHITAQTICSIYISAGTTHTHSLTTCSKYRDVLFHTAMSFILLLYTLWTLKLTRNWLQSSRHHWINKNGTADYVNIVQHNTQQTQKKKVMSEFFGYPWFGSTTKPTLNTTVCSPESVAV